MSNQQQPPYGQPYGQPQGQPQHPYGQQPQYGGYPPPPPPQGSNKTLLIVFSVVVAVAVLGAGVFIVSRFAGGGDGGTAAGPSAPAQSQPTTAPPSSPVQSQPTTAPPSSPGESPAASGSPSAPSSTAPAATQPCRGCMPGITVKGSLKALKAKGYACKDDGILGIRCSKGNLGVTVHPDYTDKAYVERIEISGSAGAQKQRCPECITGAIAAVKQGIPTVLPLFVADAAIRRQLITFAGPGVGIPDAGPSSNRDLAIRELYRASTSGYSGATVGKNGKYGTSYSTSLYVSGWRA